MADITVKERPMLGKAKTFPMSLWLVFPGFLFLLALVGCATREELFLQKEVRNLAFVDKGVGTVGCGRAYEVAAESRRLGIDLFGAYQRNRQDRHLRASLAYLLILQESELYVEFASNNTNEMLDAKEFLLWAALLTKEEVKLNDRFRERLLGILVPATKEAPFAPYVRVAVAWNLMAKGGYAEGVREMLDVAKSDSFWNLEASFRLDQALRNLPAERRAELLLPYLESNSAEGACAAAILGGTPEYRQRALEYLGHLKTTGIAKLEAEAEFAEKQIRERAQQDDDENR